MVELNRRLFLGSAIVGLASAASLSVAEPAEAAAYLRSKGKWTINLDCTMTYDGYGRPNGYSVNSGRVRYTGDIPSACVGIAGIYASGFLLVSEAGYSVNAMSGSWIETTKPVKSRSFTPKYPNNQVRNRTVNGSSYPWRSFGIAFYGVPAAVAWGNTCAGGKTYLMYQPFYNRWLAKGTYGPWNA